MEFTGIPGTDLQVSCIALGTWAMGGWMWGGTDEDGPLSPSMPLSIKAST
jgi:aryl-alcohol dehydrogenase-like predicted oxidoreductase